MRAAFAVAMGFLAGSIATSHAFVSYINPAGNVLRWNLVSPNPAVHTNVLNRSTKAIRYFVASDLYSQANRTNELNAVRACFGQWQAVPGTILKFEEGGFVGPGVDIRRDNTNVIFWAKTSTLINGGTDDIHGLRGYTVTLFTPDNTILEADTVLNGVEFNWFTDFNDIDRVDAFLESALLHEIGHFIGLDHSPVGGATVTQGGYGIDTEVGLSSDEIAAVRALYPQPSITATLGHLRGRVLMNGAGVFGAMVTAENEAGNAVAGTISRVNGSYELLAVPPGNYRIRASPLDPSSFDDVSSLMRGRDIAGDYDSVMTAFLPATNIAINLNTGVTNVLDLTVLAGNPPFRISAISHPTDLLELDTVRRFAGTIRLGQNNLFVGVSSTSLPTSGATLTVTGDGLTLGQPIFKPNRFAGGQNFIVVPISVAANATPGLRSFIVQQGNNLAYANGYLEILPVVPDYNFDGFDDRFQRQYFPVFTAPDAAPDADADRDGFSNRFESETGSDPTNALSVRFRIVNVTLSSSGSLVSSQTAPGKRFQLFSRSALGPGSWQPVGSPVVASNSLTFFFDPKAANQMLFYRVQQLP
jgi:hypothetical protein